MILELESDRPNTSTLMKEKALSHLVLFSTRTSIEKAVSKFSSVNEIFWRGFRQAVSRNDMLWDPQEENTKMVSLSCRLVSYRLDDRPLRQEVSEAFSLIYRATRFSNGFRHNYRRGYYSTQYHGSSGLPVAGSKAKATHGGYGWPNDRITAYWFLVIGSCDV